MFVYGSGDVLISGGTDCVNFPKNNTPLGGPVERHMADPLHPVNVTNGFVTNPGNFDAFLTKLSTANGNVEWTTFLGSQGNESAYSGIGVDANGAIYVAGNTNCHKWDTDPEQYYTVGLPTDANSFQQTYQGGKQAGQNTQLYHNPIGDGFVARFSAAGGLSWVTYLGGNHQDSISGNDGLHVGGDNGLIYLVGATRSGNFPVSPFAPPGSDPPAPFNSAHLNPGNETEGFVTSLNYTLTTTSLNRSTFIGGGGNEELGGIDVDRFGRVHFSGDTNSPTVAQGRHYPVTQTAYQSTKPVGANFIEGVYTVIDADLSVLFYSTYMGSISEASAQDRGRSLDLRSNKTYISGDTDSTSFIPSGTLAGFQNTISPTGTGDGFIMRFTW